MKHAIQSLESLCWCRDCGAPVLRADAIEERCPACAHGTDTRSDGELRATYVALREASGCVLSFAMGVQIADAMAVLEASGAGDEDHS